MMDETFSAKIKADAIAYHTSPESDFGFDSSTGAITDYFGNDTDIIIPSTIGGVPVTAIAENAFSNGYIKSVVIPNSVTTINMVAFFNNKLTKVVIPNSVTYIGDEAFENNEITRIVIPNSVTTIEGYAFSLNNITSVVIPSSITTINYC